ncbi:MAG: hypothetical protein HDR22_01985 [Lachnospiraceae bacterium]|nr:hypothetical protein [Lachnospiraceae bacterium]
MVRTLFSEYKKAVYEKGILLTAAGICLIHLINLIDEMNLHPTHESGSVLYFWVNRHGLGAFSIMVFLFCGISYGIQFCLERNTGSWKYYLIRENPISYGLSKIIVTTTTSLFSAMAGYVFLFLFLSCKYAMFPDDEMYLEQMVMWLPFSQLAMEKNCLFFFLNIMPEVLMFMFLSMVSLLTSMFSHSKYVAIAAPLIIYYGWNYLTGTLQLPEIFQWPLKIKTGFQFWESSVQNLLFTIAYYLTGIIIIGFLFIKKLKGEMEYA